MSGYKKHRSGKFKDEHGRKGLAKNKAQIGADKNREQAELGGNGLSVSESLKIAEREEKIRSLAVNVHTDIDTPANKPLKPSMTKPEEEECCVPLSSADQEALKALFKKKKKRRNLKALNKMSGRLLSCIERKALFLHV